MATPEKRPSPEPDRQEDDFPAPLETRPVVAADPALSPETNERLTHELREVIGTEQVEVPRNRPHASRGEQPANRGLAEFWSVNRLALVIGTLIVLTFAAILALTTGQWWILGVAAAVHSLGTTSVWLLAWRTTTIGEHPDPTVAAAMSEDGVHSPDEVFSRMVDEFRPEPQPGVGEAIAPGYNERETSAQENAAQAGAEQASALTPTSGPSQPVRFGGPTDFLIWTVQFSLAVASLAIGAALGGWMWLVPAIVVPFAAGSAVLQWLMDRRPEALHPRSWRPLALTAAAIVVTVGIFCALIALFIH